MVCRRRHATAGVEPHEVECDRRFGRNAACDLAHVQEPGAATDAELDGSHPANSPRQGLVGRVQESERMLLTNYEVEEDLASEAAQSRDADR